MDDKTLHQLSSTVVDVVSPEEYGRKRAQIQAAKVFLERMESVNESGRAKYESELLQKIREGEEARQRLHELERYHNSRMTGPLTIEAAPSSARIEEVSASPPLPQGGQFTTGSTHSQKPFQSPHPHNIPAAPTAPYYNHLLQQQPYRENQYYSGAPFRQHAPQNHYPAVPQSQSARVQQGPHPSVSHQMPTANYKPQGGSFIHYQNPPVARRRPSTSQIPVQSQVQTASVHSSVSQVQVNGTAYQDSQRPVHYNQTGVHTVGTSSLMGALGTQSSQSVQPSAPPPFPTSTSSPAIPANVPRSPRVDQVPNASNPQIPGTRPAPLSKSDLEDRRLKILAFRSSIMEWAATSQPNTYTEFYNIKVHKALNSALYITSLAKGREITEEQQAFFERLWMTAGLPADTIPFKQGPTNTNGISGSDTTSAGVPPSTVPPAIAKTTQSVSTPPKTLRQRTLVDSVTGTWRSPADADKRRLARDVMHALGKRKQDSVSHSSPNENPAKRQALDAPSMSGSVHRVSEPVIRTSTTATTLPAPQVTTQQTEQPLQSELTGKTMTVTQATNGISLKPSLQSIEPPQPTIVAPSATLPSYSESRPLEDNNLESQSFPTPSVSSVQNGEADRTPSQVTQRLSEGPTTLPTHPTASTVSLQEEPESAPATSVTSSLVALPNISIANRGAIATSSNEADNQPRSSTMLAASNTNPFDPPASSQVKPDLPSSSQVNRNEEDMKSSSNVGAIWLSGFDPSQEASTAKAREPLFLPSPSPSPSPSSLPSKKNKPSSSVYVLVPPPPEYLIRYRKRQRMKDELDSQKDSTRTSSFVSKTSRSLEAFSLPLEIQRDVPIDPYEQEAVRFSCSRLQPMPCRWGECDILLNSVDALIHHLNREHKPAGISYICRWTQCGRQCRFHEKHLERHAMMTLQCAYQGCKESYRASSQLLKHFRAKHLNGVLKVQAKPFRPQPQPPVPLPNTILPSYLVVTAPVLPAPISPDEHSILGPWVLRNVAGFDIERPKRERKSSSTPAASNTYEFLNMRSTRYSWNHSEPVAMDFGDLDSEEISKECDQGLTFFGTEDTARVEDILSSDDEVVSPSPLFFSSPPNINGGQTSNFDRLDSQTTNTEPSDGEVQKLLIE